MRKELTIKSHYSNRNTYITWLKCGYKMVLEKNVVFTSVKVYVNFAVFIALVAVAVKDYAKCWSFPVNLLL